MPNILIINTPGLLNKGGMAALTGALLSLRASLPDAQVTVLCHHPREDWEALQRICNRYQVDVKEHPWFKEHDSRLLTLLHSAAPAVFLLLQSAFGSVVRKLGLEPKGIFHESDVILALDIDSLHDHYGVFVPAFTLYNLLLGIVAGKLVVVWGAGIGRFKRKTTKLVAKLILNRVEMIVVREKVSERYLGSIGVKKPRIEATADHAFFMNPAPEARVHEILANEGVTKGDKPLVGIAPSQLIHRYAFLGMSSEDEKYRQLIEVMVELVEHLIEKLDADVLLIAHVIMPREDDRVICENIRQNVRNKNRVKVLAGDYMADELKGIIGVCDIFIGARMHPMIASTSMGVPTIPIIYGEKAYGILGEMMGQGEYMVEIAKYDPDKLLSELKAKIDQAWTRKETIRDVLKKRAAIAKQRAALNGTLVKSWLINRSPTR